MRDWSWGAQGGTGGAEETEWGAQRRSWEAQGRSGGHRVELGGSDREFMSLKLPAWIWW